jgi:2-methylisocitrate lyase-like PEP mutase family enzyme
MVLNNEAGARKLREMIDSGRSLVVPGAFNALSARMVEDAGFEAVYATGAGISNAYLGVADLGLLTMSETADHVRAMSSVLSIPLLVDIDTGYGGVHNVARVIREVEAAGAAAVQIEDQTLPKRCGHFDRKEVVPEREMVAKLRAAVDSREGDLLIIGRTDAVAMEGYEAAIRRAELYVEAGADVIFVEALQDEEQIRDLPRRITAPKLINMVEGGRTPFLPLDELEALGYNIIAFANFALRAAMKHLQAALAKLKRAGTSQDLLDEILTWDERQASVGLPEFERRESHWHEEARALLDGARSPGSGR